MSAPDLQQQVETVAAGPAATKFDGTEVQQHDLKTLDEVAARQAANRAVTKPHRGLRFTKLVPPGGLGE